MSDLPPDLARLRTVVTYLRASLGRAEQALAVAEQQASLDAAKRPPPEPALFWAYIGLGIGLSKTDSPAPASSPASRTDTSSPPPTATASPTGCSSP
ncbi:hypothetical protein [Streptomyces sp. NPDC093093]|uniref:hypothetical protein n=1 Tax=Streptomyces sp. NPDC093093 TaxID=3366025 RepID=UPI00380CBAD5